MNGGQQISIWRSDFKASLVVFLVALPLAMGIAIASGYPPVAGLISGVIGGLFVGSISGSPLQVSGAAAGLAVLVYEGVQRFGLEQMGLVLVCAGLLQLGAGVLGLGRWFQAVSPTILHAMLAGIGALIVVSQLHVMLDATPVGSGIANLYALPETYRKVWADESWQAARAFGLGLLTIAVLLAWPKFAGKRLGILPAPLMAIALATLIAWASSAVVYYVHIPSDLFAAWQFSNLDFMAFGRHPALFALAVQLALIASAESLLCASAMDRMHHGPRTRFDRELSAQGLGNAVCGLLGALPITGVIVRSSANLHAGAKTRRSTMLHGLWLLLFVALLPGVLSLVPTAALAGLLVYTGAKLISIKAIRAVRGYGRSELLIYVTTFSLIVAYDLLLGVVVGLALSGLKVFFALTKLNITQSQEQDAGKMTIELEGAATFLHLPKIASSFESLPRGVTVRIRSRDLHLLDHACAEHLHVWKQRYENQGGKVEIDEMIITRKRRRRVEATV